MSIDKNKVEKRFLIGLSQAYLNYDCSYIANQIADDFTYSSFWVFASIDSAEEYLDYLKGKLATQKKSNYKSDFCIVKQLKTGKPILLLTPKTPQGDYGCFIAECDDNGLIYKLDIMPSSFYHWEADDIEEFEEFQNRNR